MQPGAELPDFGASEEGRPSLAHRCPPRG